MHLVATYFLASVSTQSGLCSLHFQMTAGTQVVLLRPGVLACLFPFLSLQGACRLEATSSVVRLGCTWGWARKFECFCTRHGLGTEQVAQAKGQELDWRHRTRWVAERQLRSSRPLRGHLVDYWRAMALSFLPICWSIVTTVVLHRLQLASSPFDVGEALSAAIEGWYSSRPDCSMTCTRSICDLVSFVSKLELADLIEIFNVQMVFGLALVLCELYDHASARFGRLVLLMPLKRLNFDLEEHRCAAVFLGSAVASISALALAIATAFVAYCAARWRDMDLARRVMEEA